MPVKILKIEDGSAFILERVLYTKRYTLFLDRNRCVGCDLCIVACPKEAIKIVNPSDFADVENPPKKITVKVLDDKCNFCGICSEICIFGAFKQSVDDEEFIPVLKSESFPKVIHEVEVDENKCPIGCKVCEEVCPLSLIKVKWNWGQETDGKVKVEVDKDHCPVCRICEVKCPYNAIHTRKIISGLIKVNVDLCPEGCRACVDACPIPNVLFVSNDGKVNVNDSFCVYCGACKNACPVEGAIDLRRISVHHTPVKSGAWNKTLERLTSTENMAKELRSKSVFKTYESVKKLHVRSRVGK